MEPSLQLWGPLFSWGSRSSGFHIPPPANVVVYLPSGPLRAWKPGRLPSLLQKLRLIDLQPLKTWATGIKSQRFRLSQYFHINIGTIQVKLINGSVLSQTLACVFSLTLTHITYNAQHTPCAFLYSGSFFEGISRDKTKGVKGDEIAWSRRERTWDNVFSEGQSEITEELPVLQNKII